MIISSSRESDCEPAPVVVTVDENQRDSGGEQVQDGSRAVLDEVLVLPAPVLQVLEWPAVGGQAHHQPGPEPNHVQPHVCHIRPCTAGHLSNVYHAWRCGVA